MKNPIYQRQSNRVFRGGGWGWALTPNALRCTERAVHMSSHRSNYLGFRIFRTKEQS